RHRPAPGAREDHRSRQHPDARHRRGHREPALAPADHLRARHLRGPRRHEARGASPPGLPRHRAARGQATHELRRQQVARLGISLTLLLVALLGASDARATVLEALSLETRAERADAVVWARVGPSTSRMVNRDGQLVAVTVTRLYPFEWLK